VLLRFGLVADSEHPLTPIRHAFTHFRLTLEPVLCIVDPTPALSEPGVEWVALERAAGAGVPAPIRKLIGRIAAAGD
jgi:A/G-specific adenine glycosylase